MKRWIGYANDKLAKKHLEDGTLVLYDVSSSYYTGRQSELIKMGYSRDGKPGEPQIVYGLLCAPDGCPVAIEVFSGNTADPTTFTAQVNKIRGRFGITRVVSRETTRCAVNGAWICSVLVCIMIH
jgi:transposase